ncbi:peptidyl-tRNA hydrolase, PTH1 family [Thermosulfidibacter takaii ABI70S6]|uniref:Peptidyl-tRNA hydrolase n=1 Tax=Thermosulfidibacter takaii (strain DSM 17441 / JCM 13301 / NBRC 103674 / ABI70S6) TaxID=1298851 RepID=A0A0S3QVR0_THET7|nr:aminoacyl-tRNA hydrolase [Thermosulfidibacter takaii]BAT72402.1 peptidyl-tRNA hydrolase, PTH1 family [Thermosulfidibacter takaii ABI70S6]
MIPKLIVGLGNPGPQYKYTRHNFGFLVVDLLTEEWSIPLDKEAEFSVYGHGYVKDVEVYLIKPLTYMNCSGVALKEWFERYPVTENNVLVVHDDLDLPEGHVRMKKGGGHGGHRGLMSIFEETGKSGFARVRIGTGRPPGKERDREAIVEWLLSPLDPEKIKELEISFRKAARCVEDFVLYGIDRAMGNCNKRNSVLT